MKKISVVGLGKLGASMAASFAKSGFDVIGVDINQHAVDAVNGGHAPVQETNLEETINQNKDRLKATMDHEEAVLHSDITFVIVPTPSDENGAFSLQYAIWAFRQLGQALKHKKSYHNVIMTSTVLPGSMRFSLLPVLEQESRKQCGRDFGLCYSPEFIALGNVIQDFLNPDITLVGEFDERCGQELEDFYSQALDNNAPCKRMSFENAELTKIALNSFVTTKITFANMLSELCENIPGGDVDVVTDALGADKRIGRKYLTGGLGYGGPCFPRDNVALGYISKAIGVPSEMAETTDRMNRNIPEKISTMLLNIIPPGSTVGILGLAYKPFSHVVEESQGLLLAKSLAQKGLRVIGYDPLAENEARRELGDKAVVLESMEELLIQSDVILVTTPDPAFESLTPEDFSKTEKHEIIVIDFWRILSNNLSDKPNIRYVPIGKSTNDEINSARLKEIWGQC